MELSVWRLLFPSSTFEGFNAEKELNTELEGLSVPCNVPSSCSCIISDVIISTFVAAFVVVAVVMGSLIDSRLCPSIYL